MPFKSHINTFFSKIGKSWLFRKITDDWIFGEVLIISTAFIIAYGVNFHGQGLSPKAEDWAYFATYLSGTVGVTAVVGTLIVLVRTLGHQKALIKSQDEMLQDQKKQLRFSEQQLKEAMAKEKRDIAFANIRDTLPLVLTGFKRSLELNFKPEEGGNVIIYFDSLNETGFHDYKLKNVIKKLCCLNCFVESGRLDKSEFNNYAVQVLGNARHLCDFLVENLEMSKSLFYAADALLSQVVDENGWTYWDYIECNLAFLSGYDEDYPKKPYCRLLRERKSYFHSSKPQLIEFHQLGVLLK